MGLLVDKHSTSPLRRGPGIGQEQELRRACWLASSGPHSIVGCSWLGIGFPYLAFLLRPFAMSWLGLGVAGAAMVMVYLVAGVATGVFGESEKRAMTGLLQMVRKAV